MLRIFSLPTFFTISSKPASLDKLDLWGESISSEQLAAKIEKIYTYQSSNLTFVIGGSLGLSPELVKRADFRWKLSDCTFTHQMVRVLVLEQFYRATMINRHMPYHK